jgi:hypothetical protein
MNCKYELNLKYIVELTLRSIPAGLYFVLKYFSFVYTLHTA